jgi:hypothetical protein
MNTFMDHKGIKFELLINEPPVKLAGRGWAHCAQLIGKYERDQLKDLIGCVLWGEPVIGVESFAISNQTNKRIAFLLREKKW